MAHKAIAATSLQRLRPKSTVALHSHSQPYAALVLDGSYREFGDGGRRMAAPGEVLVHGPFTAHADITGPAGATIMNFELPLVVSIRLRNRVVADPDELRRAIKERDFDLSSYLEACPPVPEPTMTDAPDLLVAALEKPGELRIESWADFRGISPRTLRRHFQDAIGMTPALYRSRARARGAWRQIVSTQEALSAIAADWGFSDQAHLTRSIRLMTGRTPNAWRSLIRMSD